MASVLRVNEIDWALITYILFEILSNERFSEKKRFVLYNISL